MGLRARIQRMLKLKNTYSRKSVAMPSQKASMKKCYFCGKTKQLIKYTDGKQQLKVCPLCAEYAHRRAYKRN
jgi:acetyl-CoA carboxylase beta subunit